MLPEKHVPSSERNNGRFCAARDSATCSVKECGRFMVRRLGDEMMECGAGGSAWWPAIVAADECSVLAVVAVDCLGPLPIRRRFRLRRSGRTAGFGKKVDRFDDANDCQCEELPHGGMMLDWGYSRPRNRRAFCRCSSLIQVPATPLSAAARIAISSSQPATGIKSGTASNGLRT